MREAITELPGALRAELAELTLLGPRARLSLRAALAVGLATLVSLALRLGDPWWAGISAFMCTQASTSQLVTNGLSRVAGTAAGATIGFALAPWVVYDPAATLLLLFTAGTLAILGSLLSPHGHAWLLGGVTTVIVTLGSLDQPTRALSIALDRTAEITVGVLAALLMAILLGERGSPGEAQAPGWPSLFDREWHALRHAVRTGLVIASVPVVWRVLELPDLSQMAISVISVMAVPALTGDAGLDRAAVSRRAVRRLTGCALGGGLGVLLLALPLSDAFLPWLSMLMLGAGAGVQIQSGRHGIGVVGSQAAVALILTLAQGEGPPASLAPAVERIAGMLGALVLMLIATLLLGPLEAITHEETGKI